MKIFSLLKPIQKPFVIAALRLPAFTFFQDINQFSINQIIDFAIKNTEIAVKGKVDAVYLQDMDNYPISTPSDPYTVAILTSIGREVRRAFPHINLGLSLVSPGAREPLAIAHAIEAQFVRIKVFIGAMIRSEGIVQGCAYDAQVYRKLLGISNEIQILADVHDRDGTPLGNVPFPQAAREGALYGKADGVVITGKSFDGSLQMLAQANQLQLETPLFIGGSVDFDNVHLLKGNVDGMIVSKHFMDPEQDNITHTGVDWSLERIENFMTHVNQIWLP